MSFIETRFPKDVSYGSTGGPRRRVDIVTLASGHEERNTPWAHTRRQYNVAYGIRAIEQAYAVVEFFEAMHGPLYGFRYLDWADYKSTGVNNETSHTDQTLCAVSGSTTQFQVSKTYSVGGQSYTRTINKLVTDTLKVGVGGSLVTAGFTVDNNTGIITFSAAPGAVVTAGFEFDVPVRFSEDYLPINLANFEAGEIGDIPLLEIRV